MTQTGMQDEMNEFEQRRLALCEASMRQWQSLFDEEGGLVREPNPAGMEMGPLHHEGAVYDIRASTYLATALAVTGDIDTACEILGRTLAYQDRRADSFTRGNFFWRTHWSEVHDPNAVSFIAPCHAFLLLHYSYHMAPDLRHALTDALALEGEALLALRITWQYTNIALLNIAAQLLIV